MTLKLITAPAIEPVTLAEAKVQCRVDTDLTAEDDLLSALISTAREMAEHEIGRALINQTWERVLDAFPAAEIELGMPPVSSIVSVTYIDAAGDSQTLASAAYTLEPDLLPGWLLPAEGYEWPDTLDTANAVRVRFVAGYGDSAPNVPASSRVRIRSTAGCPPSFQRSTSSLRARAAAIAWPSSLPRATGFHPASRRVLLGCQYQLTLPFLAFLGTRQGMRICAIGKGPGAASRGEG